MSLQVDRFFWRKPLGQQDAAATNAASGARAEIKARCAAVRRLATKRRKFLEREDFQGFVLQAFSPAFCRQTEKFTGFAALLSRGMQ
jgi:hypothetical protein